FLRRSSGGVESQLGLVWGLVRVVDAGEVLQLAGARFLVQPFGVALLACVDRRVDVDLDERQFALDMQSADAVAVLAIRADKAGHRNEAGVREELGHLSDAANVLLAVRS